MKKEIFHSARRTLISKMLIDIVKLSAVAAFVSEFFRDFVISIKITVGVILLTFLFIGFFLCPSESKGD